MGDGAEEERRTSPVALHFEFHRRRCESDPVMASNMRASKHMRFERLCFHVDILQVATKRNISLSSKASA